MSLMIKQTKKKQAVCGLEEDKWVSALQKAHEVSCKHICLNRGKIYLQDSYLYDCPMFLGMMHIYSIPYRQSVDMRCETCHTVRPTTTKKNNIATTNFSFVIVVPFMLFSVMIPS